ncbi:MAG TPA: FAD-dependent oxidoreductase [Capsulimonadaceae bacterium]|nr:FAD-dependent oxidoreductase [Capsulimonadaceae bacterium]
MESRCDILVVGGGTGGVAAAMAAAGMGLRVIVTEETDWLGGQLTSQAVPPDEHRWIEMFGCTASYRRFRNGVRQYYRDHYPLNAEAHANPLLNPGRGYVSRLCHEPRVALAVIEHMMAYPRPAGFLEVRLRYKAIDAQTDGDKVTAVHFQNLETGDTETISAPYILDATELGDLLALAGVEYVTGAEAQSETGEPHAKEKAEPDNVQAITWCFPMAYEDGADHTIEKPAMYDHWRDYKPDLKPTPWPGPMIGWDGTHPITQEPVRRMLFAPEGGSLYSSLWLYRRIICKDIYPPERAPDEVTLVNWPQNDYLAINIIDKSADVVQKALYEAKQVSLSLLYWMQTESPRPDGGTGYPGLYLRPDLVGTADGLAKYAYIRESRRIRAVFTVTENHVGADVRKEQGKTAAEVFADSVGVGCYRIDLHPSTGGDNYLDISSLPFQIPLGALLPIRVKNLLPACKNLGVTHITNGCYRLHPVEWNIGESAGLLAAFCITRKVTPHQVREKEELLKEFQLMLFHQGVETEWPAVHAV